MHHVVLQVGDLLDVLLNRLRGPELQCMCELQYLFKLMKLRHENIKLTLKDQLGDNFVPISTAKYELMSSDCQECHDSSPHIQRAL